VLADVNNTTCWKAGLARRIDAVIYVPMVPVPPKMRILVGVKDAMVLERETNSLRRLG
jgi:hypothetical protein